MVFCRGKNAFSCPLRSGPCSGDTVAGRRDADAEVIQHPPGMVPCQRQWSWSVAGAGLWPAGAAAGGGGCWQPR